MSTLCVKNYFLYRETNITEIALGRKNLRIPGGGLMSMKNAQK